MPEKVQRIIMNSSLSGRADVLVVAWDTLYAIVATVKRMSKNGVGLADVLAVVVGVLFSVALIGFIVLAFCCRR